MKDHTLQSFFIISAHQDGESTNETNDNVLGQYLDNLALPNEKATGTYNKTLERSRVVFSDDEYKAKFLIDMFNQESYLFVHNDRTAQLVYRDGTRKSLPGTFREINPDFIGNDNYTKVGDKYYSVY